ncbi:MAG: recombinase family protein [Pseudobutyrivibrio ruminis]|uniref:Recombinase family protein n=1 Tax=Pseudobutyrivibrio ruminis TaxID=46206 RepID=A0A927U7P6_9FIRM|nr:recombinase family protein [Pseudobutyrivibrio ruminis]
MTKERTKVYIYTRVSTAMQIDGYSLEAQKTRMKGFCAYNEYEIAGEYEDAGKSGKSTVDRLAFNKMIEDIKAGKDDVRFVLVFKLSRFGRNAADVLSTLQVMQDFGVDLICVEDGIDSSKDAGKLMISVLSAVAEIERENIRAQTMEGRMQKAREGKWNGGMAPYGYKLVDGNLVINEEEAEVIRKIFEVYVNTTHGPSGVAKYLSNHGIKKVKRRDWENEYFSEHTIRLILQNPVYIGKIAFGRRKTQKVKGTRNEYQIVNSDDYITADGAHEAIVSEDLWEAANAKMKKRSHKYSRVNKPKEERTHLLTGIVKCPICGTGLYANKATKKKADGTFYKDFYYYSCKHRKKDRGHVCTYRKQINEELLDAAVIESIIRMTQSRKFAQEIKRKIKAEVDTTELDKEIKELKAQLRKCYNRKEAINNDIDSLDVEDKHYSRRKYDLECSLYKIYDKIDRTEELLLAAQAKRQAIIANKVSADNVYKALVYFDKYVVDMTDAECREFITQLIEKVEVYEERQPDGKWIKDIKFKIPMINNETLFGLDNLNQLETIAKIERIK